MKFLSLILAAVVTAGASLALTAQAGDRARADDVRQLRESGKILSAEDIIARARKIQPGQLVGLELEREAGRMVYEIKLIDTANKLHKLELDAASGELLSHREK
ncbi:PepSY domain-containing protein [Zoogloea sp. 1C4]|jgi:uncharacterized membrane protein YkoI|uniref:PepSY domain-containing protein n=1 Tax=Zoogloea sp. 1C4 TaxID=2570190 RepID=UPI00129245EB|nr:PepSY domain-containing protein [Zoogloea sp. 1C4]